MFNVVEFVQNILLIFAAFLNSLFSWFRAFLGGYRLALCAG